MSTEKKTNKWIKLAPAIGGAVVFALLTVSFSPMLWMATVLATLPIVIPLLLIASTLYMNLVEKQTEDKRAK